MNLYDRYLTEQTEELYEEISSLGDKAFSTTNFNDVAKVLKDWK